MITGGCFGFTVDIPTCQISRDFALTCDGGDHSYATLMTYSTITSRWYVRFTYFTAATGITETIVQWSIAGAAFNGLGSNTLTNDGLPLPGDDPGPCDGWPASITLVPTVC